MAPQSPPFDGLARPFHELLGIHVIAREGGESIVELVERPAIQNIHDVVHGGAIASLIDVAGAMAARSGAPDSPGVATITLSIAFVAPGKGTLVARGKVLRSGRTVVATEVRVEDAAGDTVAQALLSYRIMRPRPG